MAEILDDPNFTNLDTSDDNEFTKLVLKCRELFDRSSTIDVDCVKTILSEYQSNPTDWTKYVTWDHHRYTRNLVDQGNGRYNLMILCWGESHVSPVHDHPGSNCFIKMLKGSLQETLYNMPNSSNEHKTKQLQVISRKSLIKDEITYLHDAYGVHAIENLSHTEGAITLHLYIPPFQSSNVYDIYTSKKRSVAMTFTTKGGKFVT